MAIINIAAFFICLLMLACLWQESLVEIFPVLTCMLVLTLYVLAFFRHLGWIDGIGIFVIAAFLIWIATRSKEKGIEFGKLCLRNITQASFITAMLLLITVIICTSQKVVTWWDDINFWATDVKSLYYLDGFAAKYGNVAPEFGDYPPGGQLLKWWFLHWSPSAFREGLAFAGYYVMNIVFMLPLLRKIKGKNVMVMCLMAAALWFLPSIAEVYGYDGFCADLTLACIYGGFLFAVTDREEGKEVFYYSRLCLYLCVLVLVKSVGFIWAAFGLVFFGLYQWISRKEKEKGQRSAEEKNSRNLERLKMLAVCAAPLLTGASWMIFCFLMRRVTRTTATAVKYITTDEYGISGYTGDFAKAFLEAFVSLPLHKEKSVVFDLTPLTFYLCICLLVIFFFRKRLMPRKLGKLVLWFTIISGALFYGIIFIAHITIFATETQYLEASGMISSIERYGAPFTIGTLLFLANIWMTYGTHLFPATSVWITGGSHVPVQRSILFLAKYGTCLGFILFVALTAGWRTGYHGIIGYRSETEGQLAERADMIDADASVFLEAVRKLGTEDSVRVCYVQRDDAPRWVKNSYTNLEASPISVVYKSVNLNDAVTDWMTQEIRDSHASYLYVADTDADTAAVFDKITVSGDFSCETLYRIQDDGIRMQLVQVP